MTNYLTNKLTHLFRNSLGLSSSSWMMKKQTWASFPSWFLRAMLRTSLNRRYLEVRG